MQTYVRFKADCELEEYLFSIIDVKLRRYIMQPRLNNHGLQIDMGDTIHPQQFMNEVYIVI